MESGSENSCPNVWSSCGSARQVFSLELLFPSLLCKLNAADGYRRCLESLEPEHRAESAVDSAMILLHNYCSGTCWIVSQRGALSLPLISTP
jgi:hypothetical protein